MNRQMVAQPEAKSEPPIRGGVLQRKCACGQHTGGGECEECRKKKQSLQRKEGSGGEPVSVPPLVHEVLRSPGRPLDPAVRTFMEPRFGRDFSGVRTHDDVQAGRSAQSIGALAYTVGKDVVFDHGQYAPETQRGRELIAHELTHTLQQGATGVVNLDHLRLETGRADQEQMADRVARSVVRNERVALPTSGTAVAIQRSTPDPTFGTAKSTAPVASNKIKPQNIMLGELTHEVELFTAAQLVIEWAKKKQAASPQPPAAESGQEAQKAASSFAFSAADLFVDKTTIKKIKPIPKDEVELISILDLLVDYGVLSRPIYFDLADTEPKYSLITDKTKGVPTTEKFAEAQAETSKFTEAFKKRVAKNDPLASVVSTGTIPTAWSSDLAQVKEEGKAEAGLADLKMQLGEFLVILTPLGGKQRSPLARATTDTPTPVQDKSGKTVAWEIPIATQKKPVRFGDPFEKIEKVADGTHPETVKRRELIEKAIKKAEADLKSKGRYRTFADEVVVLLSRLRKRNTTWKAGTYVGHSWAEFSADIFLNTSFDKVAAGFWNRNVVRTFFDDLNAAAEEDDGTVGKFAWKAIYNDDPLRAEINTKYGADRVLHVPHHGPHPDKLHIHLDLTPVKLSKDEVSGYEIKDGRIRILKR